MIRSRTYAISSENIETYLQESSKNKTEENLTNTKINFILDLLDFDSLSISNKKLNKKKLADKLSHLRYYRLKIKSHSSNSSSNKLFRKKIK